MWNVEICMQNKSTGAVQGPIVSEGATGSSGKAGVFSLTSLVHTCTAQSQQELHLIVASGAGQRRDLSC